MGIEKNVLVQGNGRDFPKDGQQVTVHYTGQ